MLLDNFYTITNTVVENLCKLVRNHGNYSSQGDPRFPTNLYPSVNNSDFNMGSFISTLSNSHYHLPSLVHWVLKESVHMVGVINQRKWGCYNSMGKPPFPFHKLMDNYFCKKDDGQLIITAEVSYSYCRLCRPVCKQHPLPSGTWVSPVSYFIHTPTVGLLTTYQGRYCFNSFIHPSIHPFKRHLLSALANQWARGFILLFLILTLPWGNILTPILQMTNWDLDKFINLLDQVCTMPKLVPILLLYIGQKKATDD